MKLNNTQIKQLAILGYFLVESEPQRFIAGTQFIGGYDYVSAEAALKRLEEAELVNRIWRRNFGKDLYNLEK